MNMPEGEAWAPPQTRAATFLYVSAEKGILSSWQMALMHVE